MLMKRTLLIVVGVGGIFTRSSVAAPIPSDWHSPASSNSSYKVAAAQAQASPEPGAWLSSSCSHKKLHEIYIPGTHDSSTYKWTTPTHLPPAIGTVAALLFNIVADLSRTQRLSIYQQLQAGVRVLDLRLAVNPWLIQQQRQQATWAQHRPHAEGRAGGRLLKTWTLAGTSRTLTGSRLAASLVTSHSLPGPPLIEVLDDIKRFLQEYPSEIVILLVKPDAVSVNVACIHRMAAVQGAWAAAAAVFKQRLQGVNLLTHQQVEELSVGELGSHAPCGSVLLYSDELHLHGLSAAVNSTQLEILESYGNGTRTDTTDVSQLERRLRHWLTFWQQRGWRAGNAQPDSPHKPFLLLASAEVTLGVGAIFKLLWNRAWPARHREQVPASQASLGLRSGPADGTMLSVSAEPPAPAGARTLYELGMQTNKQLLTGLLQNNKVPKAFNVWLLDSLTSDIVSFIIDLNTPPASSDSQSTTVEMPFPLMTAFNSSHNISGSNNNSHDGTVDRDWQRAT